ncbi:DUF6074 family protein [Rhizobium sp. TRM95111]|uniref:DUF6074 family protein n=1 Tax=Rhizobium alarense TaxID=2846851 RepID=UPI001F2B4D32|nr:DUF6074 family protein [Rhizobium alarense]MCF3640586.1 DUF6074 family protein [Rhizobium alarense]
MADKQEMDSATTTNARVVPFPAARRVGDVRACADMLEQLHGTPAQDYWRSHCRAMYARLIDVGCVEEEARDEVLAFQQEVHAELTDRHQARSRARGRSS